VDWFAKYDKKLVGISRNNTIFGTNNPLIPIPGVAPSVSPGPITGGGIIDPANLINFSQIIQNVTNGTNIYVAAGNYLAQCASAESTVSSELCRDRRFSQATTKKQSLLPARRFRFR